MDNLPTDDIYDLRVVESIYVPEVSPNRLILLMTLLESSMAILVKNIYISFEVASVIEGTSIQSSMSIFNEVYVPTKGTGDIVDMLVECLMPIYDYVMTYTYITYFLKNNTILLRINIMLF